jgi:hypothetical protein
VTVKKEKRMVVRNWQPAFLAALRETGQVTRSCELSDISRNTVYTHRREEPEFAIEWDKALEDAAGTLEDEAWRRARDGVNKPIVYQGMVMGTQKEYSDTLLMFMLKGIKPDKYADKVVIRISPEHAALLQRAGLSPSQMWEAMMQEVAAKVESERVE